MKEQIIELLYEHIETVHIIDSLQDCDLAAKKLESLISAEVERRVAERMGTEEDMMIYFNRNSNCLAKCSIKMPAMTRSAVLTMFGWLRSRMTEGGGK